MAHKAGWRVDVHPEDGAAYRDWALFFQDEDAAIGTALMPYKEHVQGVAGLNYRAAPLQERLEKDAASAKLFRSDVHGDPATPLLEAFAGDRAKIHVLVPFSEQAHVFNVEGHEWLLEPGRAKSDGLSAVQVGGLEAITIELHEGAGGPGVPATTSTAITASRTAKRDCGASCGSTLMMARRLRSGRCRGGDQTTVVPGHAPAQIWSRRGQPAAAPL